jgi:quinoprotein glucose dehydrogenase
MGPGPAITTKSCHDKKDGKQLTLLPRLPKPAMFLFLTGIPVNLLYLIEEQPVPPRRCLENSVAHTTPSFTTRTFVRQLFTDKDISNISPEAHEYVKNRLNGVKRSHMFEPPSLEGTLIRRGLTEAGNGSRAAIRMQGSFM